MISVITLTYNNFKELLKTCHSLEGIACIKHIVINGGECRETKKFLESYNCQSLSEADRGIADAFNKGILLSNEPYISFLNSGDVLIDKTYYQKAINIFETTENLDLIHGNNLLKHPIRGDLVLRPGFKSPRTPYCHQGMILRRKVFDLVGIYDDSFYIAMDYDHMLRMENSQIQSFHWNASIVEMDGHGISTKSEWLSLLERHKAIQKNYSGFFLIKKKILLGLMMLKFVLKENQ